MIDMFDILSSKVIATYSTEEVRHEMLMCDGKIIIVDNVYDKNGKFKYSRTPNKIIIN